MENSTNIPSKPNHTQGEWQVSQNSNQGLRILVNEEDAVKTINICSVSGSQFSDETKANAKLIAAAPSLLEALTNLYNAIDSCVDLTPELLQKAQRAINKAKI